MKKSELITTLLLLLLIFLNNTLFAQTQICNECIGGSTLANPNCDTSYVTMSYFPLENTSPWELIFEDNFNESSNPGLDFTNTWNSPNHICSGQDDLTCFKNSNLLYDPTDGWINLQTKYETGGTPCDYVISYNPLTIGSTNLYYSVPELLTYQTFGPGKFEIRCKIPNMPGQWPAFWLWGSGQEIDVFEIKQDDYDFADCQQNDAHCNNPSYLAPTDVGRRMIMTSHGANNCAPQMCHITSTPLSDGFHTYTLVWDEDYIQWFLDGVMVHQRNRFHFYTISNNQFLFSKQIDFPDPSGQMLLEISTSIWKDYIVKYFDNNSNTFVCGAPDMPVDYLIDYVRVWEHQCGTGNRTLCYDEASSYFQNPNNITVKAQNR